MSYDDRGYNPYSNPYSERQAEPADEFAATSYDQYGNSNSNVNRVPQTTTNRDSLNFGSYNQVAQTQAQTQTQVQPTDAYELEDQTNYAFFGEVDDIKRNLVQYEDNIERIESLHKRSLAESNVENETAIQRQIDTLQSETRGLAETLKTRIKKLESTSQRDATKNAQTQNLKSQFMNLIQKFQASEAAFRQRYRDALERQYRIVDPDATEAQVMQAVEDDQNQVFSQALMQSNRRGEARAALSEVQSRHREIQKIESTLTELAQLFHDMEIMVAEQDQQVTNIEQNVYHAQNDIEKGVDNQFAAIKKARSWRKKKWCCFILIVVVILFCALFFGIYFGGGYNH